MWKIKQKDKKAKIVMKWSWVTIVTITKAYYLKYSKSEEEKTMAYIPAKFAALSCGFQLGWNWGSYSFPNFSSLGRSLMHWGHSGAAEIPLNSKAWLARWTIGSPMRATGDKRKIPTDRNSLRSHSNLWVSPRSNSVQTTLTSEI